MKTNHYIFHSFSHLCLSFVLGPNLRYHIVFTFFSIHQAVTGFLVSLSYLTLAFLNNIGQLFGRITCSLNLFDVFSHLYEFMNFGGGGVIEVKCPILHMIYKNIKCNQYITINFDNLVKVWSARFLHYSYWFYLFTLNLLTVTESNQHSRNEKLIPNSLREEFQRICGYMLLAPQN